jgi:hypothetical protein
VALLTVRTLSFLSSIYKQLQNNNYNQTLPTPTPSKSQRSTTQIFIAEFGWLSAEMLTLSTKEGPMVSGVGRVTDTQWSLKIVFVLGKKRIRFHYPAKPRSIY